MASRHSAKFVLLILCHACFSDTSEATSDVHRKLSARKEPQNDARENVVEAPLLVGSFNIQTLGKKKFKNPDVIYTVERIIHRYDLILLMELMTNDKNFMENLLRDVNLFAPKGVVYNMTLSEIHPDTAEHSAFLYRTHKLKVIKSESYAGANFYRKPLLVIFEAFTLRDMTRFGVVGHHVKPTHAVQEINSLASVYDYIKSEHKVEDVLLMGDFNADCSYVGENRWDDISLWTRPEFTWGIPNHFDTTTNYRSCALDRFVYAGENMNDGVIPSSAQVFNFQKEYELSIEETRSISDHWPIELKIRGKMTDVAEKTLIADICFKIQDSHPRRNITKNDIFRLARSVHFDVISTSSGILLTHRTSEQAHLLHAVSKLQEVLPNIVSRELGEAVKYKTKHGSLEDESSFSNVRNPGFRIDVLWGKNFSEVLLCRATTVN